MGNFLADDYPIGVIVEPVNNLNFVFQVGIFDKGLEFALSEYVIISMVDSGLLVLIFNSRLDEVAVLGFCLLCRICFLLLVGIVKMPGNEYILGGELLVLLLIGPHVYEHASAYLQDPGDLAEGLDTQTVS